MNIKDQLEISKIILQTISIGIPLLGIIFSQFKGRERMMDQNKEKWVRIFNNILRFLITVLFIDLIILVSLSDVLINIKSKDLIKYKNEIYQSILLFTSFSTLFSFFLMPLWKKEKRYYEVELEHIHGEKRVYVVLNRIKSKNGDVLIYEGNDREYEEDVNLIKQRESRVTFIPKTKSLFNINRSIIDETKVFPIWLRCLFFLFVVIIFIFGIWNCYEMTKDIWTLNMGEALVMFRIVISTFPMTILIYFIVIIVFLYKSWLGKNRLPYEKNKIT
jgi:hypothetical protein